MSGRAGRMRAARLSGSFPPPRAHRHGDGGVLSAGWVTACAAVARSDRRARLAAVMDVTAPRYAVWPFFGGPALAPGPCLPAALPLARAL
ncbi:hypothetical protein AAFF_G00281540 [Aldrovandia affinis]|uniref:Uncharacterized protein n=1 Tax=Aldrovandia affinis TaxID=143900 RepID=A0AAD7R9T2_9TELE|nr:hypothetical protein AAFF_G00281540 [Aldrovandia affinis]